MEKDSVYLNKMLQNESLGLNLYYKYVDRFSDDVLKREVIDIISEHERHKMRLKNMIQVRKAEYDDSIGIKGNLSGALTSMKLMVKNKPQSLIDDIYNIESHSISVANQFLEEFSTSIRPDIEKIIEENKKNLQKLTKLKENLKHE